MNLNFDTATSMHDAALKWLIREVRTNIVVTLSLAAISSVLYGDPFGRSVLYTFYTTTTIQLLIESGRYGFSALLHRRSADRPENRRAWPGWGVMVPWVMVSGVIGYGVGQSIGNWITGVGGGTFSVVHNPRALLLSSALVAVPAIGITYFFYARGRMAELEAHSQAALRAAAENQLKLLEAQLEPHMLFNTLANLRVLIAQDPARAQHMLDRLIDFLRATLDASRRGSHPLSAEFARIGDYLELIQVRMGPRLTLRLDLPPALANLPVPPMLLQPLVENAIRHGLEPKIGGGRLEVSAARDGDTLTLTVRDTGVGLGGSLDTALNTARPGSTSFGTQQVRERLAALYGDTASFELRPAADADGGTLAIVRLPVP